ncbi:short coiled-coil protein B-like isoform X2 [Hydractinia symbiolongicarpus]|uniref:short coiled-coil protein B-like isoform X2 n=1 Tax=Hydractinia symbiolongicarpus TaxID=13093 RepID=UPI00254C9B08|nr:short coiled-coil protein B-like isoform X2 [Hydractinia symbiolongicarpus]
MAGEMVNIPLSSDDEVINHQQQNRNHNSCPQTEITLDGDEAEEKSRLIQQVFQLQNTLDDLAQRVDAVKDENVKLKSENQVCLLFLVNILRI